MSLIRLTGFTELETVTGIPGEVIEITDKNRNDCELLLKLKAAHKVTAKAEAIIQTDDNDDDDDDDEDDALTRESHVASLADRGIHARYLKALSDAGLNTIGEVADKADTLHEISGISESAANQLRAVLKAELAA